MSNYAAIKPYDIANGPGVRVSVFLSGCPHRCVGCFNSEAWDYDYGQLVTEKVYEEVEKLLARPFIEGLSLLGGEPLARRNIDTATEFARIAKKQNKSVWIYTGYTWEEILTTVLQQPYETILDLTDVIVDGRFERSFADKTLLFRGSSNQRIIDVPKSLYDYNQIILWKESCPYGSKEDC
jgi:anaerobic ribonucleoside-triphosphate reductase activating protein